MPNPKKTIGLIFCLLLAVITLSACTVASETPQTESFSARELEKIETYAETIKTGNSNNCSSAIGSICGMYEFSQTQQNKLLYQTLQEALFSRYQTIGEIYLSDAVLEKVWDFVNSCNRNLYSNATEEEKETTIDFISLILIRDETRAESAYHYGTDEFNDDMLDLLMDLRSKTPDTLRMKIFEIILELGSKYDIQKFFSDDDPAIRLRAIAAVASDVSTQLVDVAADEDDEAVRQAAIDALINLQAANPDFYQGLYAKWSTNYDDNAAVIQEVLWQCYQNGSVSFDDIAAYCNDENDKRRNRALSITRQILADEPERYDEIVPRLTSDDEDERTVAKKLLVPLLATDRTLLMDIAALYLSADDAQKATLMKTIKSTIADDEIFEYLFSQMTTAQDNTTRVAVESLLMGNSYYTEDLCYALKMYFYSTLHQMDDYSKALLMSLIFGGYDLFANDPADTMAECRQKGAEAIASLDLTPPIADCLYSALVDTYTDTDGALRNNIGHYADWLLSSDDSIAFMQRLMAEAQSAQETNDDYALHIWRCFAAADGKDYAKTAYRQYLRDPAVEELLEAEDYLQFIFNMFALSDYYAEQDEFVAYYLSSCAFSLNAEENGELLLDYYAEDLAKVAKSSYLLEDAKGIIAVYKGIDYTSFLYQDHHQVPGLPATVPDSMIPLFPQQVRYVVRYEFSGVYVCRYVRENEDDVYGYRTDVNVTIIDRKTGKKLSSKTIQGQDMPETIGRVYGGGTYYEKADYIAIEEYVQSQLSGIIAQYE